MSTLRKHSLFRYAIGLVSTFVGAWLTDLSGSMLPLALGASASLLCTVPLVKAIWSGTTRDSSER